MKRKSTTLLIEDELRSFVTQQEPFNQQAMKISRAGAGKPLKPAGQWPSSASILKNCGSLNLFYCIITYIYV